MLSNFTDKTLKTCQGFEDLEKLLRTNNYERWNTTVRRIHEQKSFVHDTGGRLRSSTGNRNLSITLAKV